MGEPYREMPMPPGPPPERRPIIERSLIAFNWLILTCIAVSDALPLMEESPAHRYHPSAGSVLLGSIPFAIPSVVALFGFLGPGRRRFRAFLVLPSAFVWLVIGSLGVIIAIAVPNSTPKDRVGSLALGLCFGVVGVVSLRLAMPRIRQS